MQITVNGEQRELPFDTNVSLLLSSLEVPPEQIAVEVNLKIIDKAQFNQTPLQEGDKVEIISFVGGGCYAG